jgi:serine/threonine protein kinase
VGAELQPGDPARIGPYRLIEVLGSGGMGQVYLGLSSAGRPVAVKVIRAELAADAEFRAVRLCQPKSHNVDRSTRNYSYSSA